jgi:hypothetical protein
MERPAFEMQYSPRFSDAVSAEIDELKYHRETPPEQGLRFLLQPVIRNGLRQEVRPFEVRRETSRNEAGDASGDVGPDAGPDPRIVDECVDPAERLSVSRTSEILSGSEAMSARIGTNFWPGTSLRRAERGGLGRSRGVPGIVDRNGEPQLRQPERDPPPQPAARPRDENHQVCSSVSFSQVILSPRHPFNLSS